MKFFIVMTFSFLISSSFAKEWKKVTCPDDLSILAKEAIVFNLSGVNLVEDTNCLSQKDLQYFTFYHEPPTENPAPKYRTISDNTKIKILSIKKKPHGTFKVHFQLNDNGTIIKDKLSVLINRDSSKIADVACAELLSVMDTNLVFNKCNQPVTKKKKKKTSLFDLLTR